MLSGYQEKPLRIAIACPGIGLVQRGFERFFYDLFQLIRNDFEVTLFKGGGKSSPNEKVLRFAHRNGILPKLFPIHKLLGRTPMHSECMTFALALLPHLRNGQYDIVHCIDPPLTRILYNLRARLGLQFKLLYTEGCAMPPSDYPPADHLHQVAKVTYDEALAHHIPEDYMTLLPCGVYPSRFKCDKSRAELRQQFNVAEDKFVILSVAAINRTHKRVDHLIEEVVKLPDSFLLWLDGSLDHGDPELLDYARKRLGDKVKITHLPSNRVGELYRVADVMAHSSLFESFGLAIVEAATCGLPVVTHNAEHFQWLLPNPRAWVDMSQPDELSQRLLRVAQDKKALQELVLDLGDRKRFVWETLRPEYLRLYRQFNERNFA